MTGIVKIWKGTYGFIIDDDSGIDYFVHQTDCVDEINIDDRVTFDPVVTDKGKAAKNVRKLMNE
jgi:cold shock CspA family protein